MCKSLQFGVDFVVSFPSSTVRFFKVTFQIIMFNEIFMGVYCSECQDSCRHRKSFRKYQSEKKPSCLPCPSLRQKYCRELRSACLILYQCIDLKEVQRPLWWKLLLEVCVCFPRHGLVKNIFRKCASLLLGYQYVFSVLYFYLVFSIFECK